LKQFYKNILILILVFTSNLIVYAQDPIHYKIGKKKLANLQIYTLLYDDSTDIIYAGTNDGLYALNKINLVELTMQKSKKELLYSL